MDDQEPSIDDQQILSVLQQLQDSPSPATSEALLESVYTQLRAVARRMLARENPGQTLQPTALVHEAYLRLAGNGDREWNGRDHFLAAASEAIRRILINRARDKGRIKRGGDFQRQEMGQVEPEIEALEVDVLAVDEALQQLEEADPRARQIVNLRFFAGFTVKETASILGLSVSTVEREWAFVRTWLMDALGNESAE